MRDAYQLLKEKEIDIARLRKEIEALHVVIPLLAEETDWADHGVASAPSFPRLQAAGTVDAKGWP